MKYREQQLYGIYDLKKIEASKNGQKTNEVANAGMFTFTRDRNVSVVSGSNEWVMAYVGTFELNEDILSIHIKSCVVREMEGTSITRKVLEMDSQILVLESTSDDQSKKTELTWVKKFSL